MEAIKLIEVKSEIAAGTRGASLGIDALKTACLDKGSDFFAQFDAEEVENMNHMMFEYAEEDIDKTAKYIEGVYTMVKRVSRTISFALEDGTFPLVLAGDHSTAAGTIAGIKKAYPFKRLGVIWIDAHADLHSPYTTPSGNMHGMPLAMVINEDNLKCKRNELTAETKEIWNKIKNIGVRGQKIRPQDLVFIAVRDTEPEEDFLIKKYGIKHFKVSDLRAKGIKKVVKETNTHLMECDIIYISFDVDSMDSNISEGTGTPVPNGLTVQEALELNCELIKNKKVCCWEMVEVNPTLDSMNQMAENAFDILEATTQCLLDRSNVPAKA
ncbi:arginase [Cytophagales bacterium LB-30]|uniref:Arginase n=1 Tax=Shiella aurantiaca TaxID=3058365 RepID=A0ABT8F3U1_9BACT|nr:arginase [Shiella aurantiaca]MDN4164973.1 arginase [Shiella aurantiaca]